MPPFEPPLTVDEVQQVYGDRMDVVEPLAAGGQGALFTVVFHGMKAVLKIYRDAVTVRAERECEALECVQSDNIVKLLEWGKEVVRGSECVFTVTEFIEGETLRARINRAPLTEQEARRLGVDVTAAISELWSHFRIVHRDIKPENIIIKSSGAAVILDLGIARHLQQDTITTWGTWLGTNGYMSPEQARARKSLTFKSDFFSLGIVLYETVAQDHPFGRRQDLVGKTEPESLRRRTGVSEPFSRVVHSMLAVDPLDRPHNCVQLIALLQGD